MNTRKIKLTLFIIFLTVFVRIEYSLAVPSGNVIGQVNYVGIYGSGRLFVQLDTVIDEPGCNNARFDVAPTNPHIKEWLAIAMLAKATGKSVTVYTNGCLGGLPTLDESTSSYFLLSP